MRDSSETRELIAQLKELTGKLGPRKGKDFWEKLSTVTPFIATVVIAGFSLFFTKFYERVEADRQHQLRQAQLSMQEAQVRIEELKALTSMVPLLASNDERTRGMGQLLLQVVLGANAVDSASAPYADLGIRATPTVAMRGTQRPRGSLFDAFAPLALTAMNPEATPAQRIDATREIGRIAASPSATDEVRERGARIAEEIAASEAPDEVRQAAAEVVEQLRAIGPGGEEILYTVDDNGQVTWLAGWDEGKVITVSIPQLQGIRGAPVSASVPFYAEAALDLQAAWAEVEERELLGLVRSWDGSYNPRQIRGTRQLSAHAVGIAFDINAQWSRPGRTPPALGEEGSVRELVPIFEKHNFRWGGNFRVPDGNHFYWTGRAGQ